MNEEFLDKIILMRNLYGSIPFCGNCYMNNNYNDCKKYRSSPITIAIIDNKIIETPCYKIIKKPSYCRKCQYRFGKGNLFENCSLLRDDGKKFPFEHHFLICENWKSNERI
jgi:hypothetical protein